MSNSPTVAQKGPFQVDLEANKPYFWCTCGKSKRQPFCDGAHKGSGFEPQRFTVTSTGTFNLCGCKSTDDGPFCDGTHNML